MNRPHVDDGLDRKGDPICLDHPKECVLVEVIGVPPLDEVLPLLGRPSSSTTMMSSIPSSLSFATKTLPMKPAPPVTTIMIL